MRATTRQAQHAHIVGISAVYAPFLVRCEEVEHDFFLAIRVFAQYFGSRFQVYRRFVHTEAFTKSPHPLMVLVELLAACNRAPRD